MTSPAGAVRWSILIATLSSRRSKLIRLLRTLLPQVDAAGGAVEVVACSNNGDPPLGCVRDTLMDAALGTWLSFCDDDDMVAGDYVAAVLDALATRPDIVQFRHAYYVANEFRSIVLCSLALEPADYPHLMHRDITHIQPVRAELARRGSFGGKMNHEDADWCKDVRPLLRTEAVIHRPLYRYLHNPADSVQYPWPGPRPVLRRPAVGSPCFRWLDVP